MMGRFDYGRWCSGWARRTAEEEEEQMEADEGERGRVEGGSSGRHVHRS